jgi:hypothetical protein
MLRIGAPGGRQVLIACNKLARAQIASCRVNHLQRASDKESEHYHLGVIFQGFGPCSILAGSAELFPHADEALPHSRERVPDNALM